MPRGAECCSAFCTHLNSSFHSWHLPAVGRYRCWPRGPTSVKWHWPMSLSQYAKTLLFWRKGLQESASKGHVMTAWGPPIQKMRLVMEDGTSKDINYLHPLATLHYFLESSIPFRDFFNSRLDSHPGCWNIIMYGDEVTPGQTLKKQNSRKVWARYWNFKELHGLRICKIVFGFFVV